LGSEKYDIRVTILSSTYDAFPKPYCTCTGQEISGYSVRRETGNANPSPEFYRTGTLLLFESLPADEIEGNNEGKICADYYCSLPASGSMLVAPDVATLLPNFSAKKKGRLKSRLSN
jgi:hypothetical protein